MMTAAAAPAVAITPAVINFKRWRPERLGLLFMFISTGPYGHAARGPMKRKPSPDKGS
jgi:hypothetical protein